MGLVLQEQGKNEEAIEAFTKALAIKPDHAGAHYNSSFALLNIGRIKEGSMRGNGVGKGPSLNHIKGIS